MTDSAKRVDGSPTVDAAQCATYTVPTDQPEADGTLAWSSTSLVVVQLSAAGERGLGWSYASKASQAIFEEQLSGVVCGAGAFDIPGIFEAMLRQCRNLGRPGAVSSAVAAADMALYDLKARILGVELADLLGRSRPTTPVYGSGGFTTYDDSTTCRQVEGWLERGISMVKIKIGESWGSAADRDMARVELVRKVIGDSVQLFVDANGGYSRKQAVRIGKRLYEDHGVVWFEEPVSSDDLPGLREVRDMVPIDVAAGEYGYDDSYFSRMIGAGAVDCLQMDATRCGGYTGWLRGAAIAGAASLQVSAHCAPAVHAPVAAAAAHARHIEYFHDHTRIEAMLFDGVPDVVEGVLPAGTGAPGHGYTLREQDAEEYRVG